MPATATLPAPALSLPGLVSERQLIEHLKSLGFRCSYPTLFNYRHRPRDPLPCRKLFGQTFYVLTEFATWLERVGRAQSARKVRDARKGR